MLIIKNKENDNERYWYRCDDCHRIAVEDNIVHDKADDDKDEFVILIKCKHLPVYVWGLEPSEITVDIVDERMDGKISRYYY